MTTRGLRKKTKIICTIGPTSMKLSVMRRLHRAGMNGVRINTAHGDFDQYSAIVENSRAVGEIPVVLDIKGPEVRTRVSKPLKVKRGDEVFAGFGDEEISFTYDFLDKVRAGDRILIDNGTLETRIKKKEAGRLCLVVLNDGTIGDRKGVNIPHRRLDLPGLSKKDLKAIDFARRNRVDFLALSFTRKADDLLNLRELTRSFEPAIMAKIEDSEGVRNIEQIIDCADAVMVARGDLGVEIPSEKVPLIQKEIIRRCNQRGKIVVTATQMLESMMKNPFPTRAETSDVANAILDGSDAVMLSGETSVGRYPVQSVKVM
ncbi:MAG: pyruvate kinase, partial [Aigarchaeota archaeon]|nr:pyruvate kinase [Aigarchaeota archaeon]